MERDGRHAEVQRVRKGSSSEVDRDWQRGEQGSSVQGRNCGRGSKEGNRNPYKELHITGAFLVDNGKVMINVKLITSFPPPRQCLSGTPSQWD